MNSPLVSILTPSFNQARWLADNLNSVAVQTYPYIEHVVVDGGSTDGTLEVLRGAAHRLLWRSEPDRGQSHALNKAFADSQGEIIGWLNSDDAYFSPTAVEEAVRLLNRSPDINVVYGHAALVDAEGLILQMLWAPPFSYELLKLVNFIIQPTAFIRRSALKGGFLDETYHYAMDRELWLRLGRKHRFGRLNSVLAIDRHQKARKSIAGRDAAYADSLRLDHQHSIPRGRWSKARGRALTSAFRVAGLSLVPAAMGTSLAFNGRVDHPLRLLLRQALTPRGAMPTGESGIQPRIGDVTLK